MEPPCFAPPKWRTENSVIIWNLLWLSRRLIIGTEPINIYTRTFPNPLTPIKATNHQISVNVSTNAIGEACHALHWVSNQARPLCLMRMKTFVAP